MKKTMTTCLCTFALAAVVLSAFLGFGEVSHAFDQAAADRAYSIGCHIQDYSYFYAAGD